MKEKAFFAISRKSNSFAYAHEDLKVVGNEKQGGSGRWQMLGTYYLGTVAVEGYLSIKNKVLVETAKLIGDYFEAMRCELFGALPL